MKRIQKLPVPASQLGIDRELLLLEMAERGGRPDPAIARIIESRISYLESQLLECPFVEPSENSGLDAGGIEVLKTAGGQSVRIGLAGGANQVTHSSLYGMPKSGKTFLQAVMAIRASGSCHTLLLDNLQNFRRMPQMAATHSFMRWEDLRLNPFDVPPGVNAHMHRSMVMHELARNYGLEFGELEGMLSLIELAKKQHPNLPDLVTLLMNQTYRGFTRRSQYRDSAVLVLLNVLHGTGEMFMCSKGMDMRRLLTTNLVLECDGLPGQHRAFLIRYIFEWMLEAVAAGQRLNRPLMIFIDEFQEVAQQRELAEKMLTLRHAGVSLVANFQNASKSPREVSANCDALFCFQTVDQEDCKAFGSAARLNVEQMKHLSQLQQRECVCFLPRSNWRTAFLAEVPQLTL